MKAIAPTLRSLDARMWSVAQPRYEWCIDEASKNSPFTITLLAFLLNMDAPPANVVGALINGYKVLASDEPKLPVYWTVEDVERMQEWNEVLGHGARVDIRVGRETIRIGHEIVANAKRCLEYQEKDIPHELSRYASIRGRVRQVTVDPDDKTGAKRRDFMLIDADTGASVRCIFDVHRAKDINATDRVVAYGEVHRDEQGLPSIIDVEDFRVLPEKLPTLRELQDLDIDITGGEDAADYVNRLRA